MEDGIFPKFCGKPSAKNMSSTWMLSHFSRVWLFATLWTIARQAPLSMGFSRQEYWNGLPCPTPGESSHPTIEPESLTSPALAGGFFTSAPPGKPLWPQTEGQFLALIPKLLVLGPWAGIWHREAILPTCNSFVKIMRVREPYSIFCNNL